MNILVACEFSGIVRDAFLAKGHNAISCDLEPTDSPGPHCQGDVTALLHHRWDLIIAHPPCTFLTSSGARWLKDQPPLKSRRPVGEARRILQQEAAKFFMQFVNCPCTKVVIENPIGVMSNLYRKPDQIVHPWEFGHGVVKATCLWLKGLPKLQPTNIVDGRYPECHRQPPGPNRSKLRSTTYPGIALAMAEQWG